MREGVLGDTMGTILKAQSVEELSFEHKSTSIRIDPGKWTYGDRDFVIANRPPAAVISPEKEQ
jgi:hypothetical protein